MQTILASEKKIDVASVSIANEKTAAEMARWTALLTQGERMQNNFITIANLIDDYARDPDAVRIKMRREPVVRGNFIAQTFALVVFLSDGYLVTGNKTPGSITRFSAICVQLPLDLQMTLCNRMFGSGKNIVASQDSEPGFRWIARAARR